MPVHQMIKPTTGVIFSSRESSHYRPGMPFVSLDRRHWVVTSADICCVNNSWTFLLWGHSRLMANIN